MKRLISKTELKKKQQRKQLIAGSVLIAVMLFSTIAYSFMDNSRSETTSTSSVVYNGVSFSKQETYFLGEKYSKSIILLNNPKEINKNISSNFSLTSDSYLNKPLYISSQDFMIEWQLNQVLGKNINNIAQRVQKACYDEKNCPENYPIKTCADNLIIVQYSNYSSINSLNNCIIISGPAENISQVSDLFILKLFEI